MTRAQFLAARRDRLLARSSRLRLDIHDDAAALARRFDFADRVVAVGRSPWFGLLAMAGAALLLFKRPRLLTRGALRLLALYPALRGLRPLLPRLVRLWRRAHDSGTEADAG